MIVTINDKIYHPFKSAPPPKPDNWFSKWLKRIIAMYLLMFVPLFFRDYDDSLLQLWYIVLLFSSVIVLFYIVSSVVLDLIKKFLKLKIVIYH